LTQRQVSPRWLKFDESERAGSVGDFPENVLNLSAVLVTLILFSQTTLGRMAMASATTDCVGLDCCGICLSQYTDDDTRGEYGMREWDKDSSCRHYFCIKCLLILWRNRATNCPMCKVDMTSMLEFLDDHEYHFSEDMYKQFGVVDELYDFFCNSDSDNDSEEGDENEND
jgi:hypothetical protein